MEAQKFNAFDADAFLRERFHARRAGIVTPVASVLAIVSSLDSGPASRRAPFEDVPCREKSKT